MHIYIVSNCIFKTVKMSFIVWNPIHGIGILIKQFSCSIVLTLGCLLHLMLARIVPIKRCKFLTYFAEFSRYLQIWSWKGFVQYFYSLVFADLWLQLQCSSLNFYTLTSNNTWIVLMIKEYLVPPFICFTKFWKILD